MKYKSFIVALSVLLTSTIAYATPDKCPSVESIIAAGIEDTPEKFGDKWVVGQTNHYNSKEAWGFAISPFDAKDEKEAVSKARAALSSLTFNLGPQEFYGKTICRYKINLGMGWAVALTPPCGSNCKVVM